MEQLNGTRTGTGSAGLATRGARWVMIAVWVTGVARGMIDHTLTIDHPMIILGYPIALGGAWLLTSRHDGPLSRAAAATLVGCALITGGTVLASPVVTGEVWLFNYASFLVALLIPRGNPVAGTSGGVALVLGASLWAAAIGLSGTVIGALIAVPTTALIVGVIWRRVLTGIVRRERLHRTATARAEREAAAARAAEVAFDHALTRARLTAEPVLQRIISGDTLEEPFVREIIRTEGTIRDSIRAPYLGHPALIAAIARARARGTTITTFSTDDGTVISDSAASRVLSLLQAPDIRRATIRAIPQESTTKVTVVIEHSAKATSHEVMDDQRRRVRAETERSMTLGMRATK